MEKNNSVYSDFPRDLPYNLEAEQSVLGAILLDSDCVPEVMQYVRPESFYRQQHQQSASAFHLRLLLAHITIPMII